MATTLIIGLTILPIIYIFKTHSTSAVTYLLPIQQVCNCHQVKRKYTIIPNNLEFTLETKIHLMITFFLRGPNEHVRACACVTYAQRAPRAACVKWVTRLDVTAGRDHIP